VTTRVLQRSDHPIVIITPGFIRSIFGTFDDMPGHLNESFNRVLVVVSAAVAAATAVVAVQRRGATRRQSIRIHKDFIGTMKRLTPL
jgi:hypothetical protein